MSVIISDAICTFVFVGLIFISLFLLYLGLSCKMRLLDQIKGIQLHIALYVYKVGAPTGHKAADVKEDSHSLHIP